MRKFGTSHPFEVFPQIRTPGQEIVHDKKTQTTETPCVTQTKFSKEKPEDSNSFMCAAAGKAPASDGWDTDDSIGQAEKPSSEDFPDAPKTDMLCIPFG